MNYSDYLKIEIPDQFGATDDIELKNGDFVFDQLPSNCTTDWGVTQFVIIDKDLIDVIKIPFRGTWESYYNDDTNADDERFVEFDNHYDIITQQIYEKAIKKNVADIFIEQIYLGETIDGTPVYRQEYVYPCSDEKIHNTTKGSRDLVNQEYKKAIVSATKSSSYWNTFRNDWLANVVDCFGLDFIKRLFDFLAENELTDFHEGNYGWRANGDPCIFDYAGYDG